MFGISAALTTPFERDFSINFARLNGHIKTLLSEGCSSVTLFGTTGEGPSVTGDTRLATLKAATQAGIDPARLLLCLHGTAISDVAGQAKTALGLGVTRFLLPPPGYFSDPPKTGLYDWFAAVLSQLQPTDAQILLYHIPQVIGVGLPIDMVAQLKAAFPETVMGVKDSSGVFDNAKALLKLPGLQILIGDERLLAAGARIGASGSISGVANVFCDRLAQVLASGDDDPAINRMIDTMLNFAVTPAVKSLVAHRYGEPDWRRTSPPLTAITDADYVVLVKAYDAVAALGS